MNKKRKHVETSAVITAMAAVIGLGVLPVFAQDNTPAGSPPDKPDEDHNGDAPLSKPSGELTGGGGDSQTYDYTGANNGKISADGDEVSSNNETVSSNTADVNAALSMNGGTLTIDGDTLNKSGDDTNGDACNFYGLNSISLTTGENAKTILSNSTLSADSEGSNGIFASDNGTVYAYKDTIQTTAGNSRGLDATYGGTILADQMKIDTKGDHSAALATDRGGGNISVTNSALSTAGSGSPLLYSTGNIQVKNVTGTADGSQIAGMEGLNTILILNYDLSSTQTDKTASDPLADGIIIYQSTSGDADTSVSEKACFQAIDSTLKSAITSGTMFYVTNTDANIVLSNTTLDFDSDQANLLYIAGNDANSWGTAGENGADVTFTGYGEILKGDITVDTISSLDAYFLDGTTYTGVTSIEKNAVNTDVSDAPITVNISSDSTWVVTDDCEVTNLNAEDGAQIVDSDGRSVSIIVNGEKVVDGDSAYSITVDHSYGTSFTTDEDNAVSTDYIDRSGFDSTFSVNTSFANDNVEAEVPSEPESTDTDTHDHQILIWISGGVIIAIIAVVLIKKRKR